MPLRNIEDIKSKRILLLQGPVGPFFARLARDLTNLGAKVFKINLNGGDWAFYPANAFNYRGTIEDWPAYLEEMIRKLDIDMVILYGDCRPMHAKAREIASLNELPVGVFEEGYIRPDFVTFEVFGVNGFSQHLQLSVKDLQHKPSLLDIKSVKMSYFHMAWYCFCYYAAGILGKLFYPNYQHHRPLNLFELFPWIRSFWRKIWFYFKERGLQERLTGPLSKRFFLVPLQVHNDYQVITHSDFNGVEDFINEVMRSFADHAPKDCWLVLKHHFMDRGYCDYTRYIERLSRSLDIESRVLYLHDQHTPSILDHAKAVVVLNSTTGLSALAHGCPTKVCGKAIYDKPGLTYQGHINQFWKDAGSHVLDQDLFQKFKYHLIVYTQLNGNFYRPLKLKNSKTGIIWNKFGGNPPVKPPG